MPLLATVRQTVREHELISVGDSILIGLSGGPDSVALLYVLSRLRRPMGLRLSAVYINHQIRKRAAEIEERFCRQLCHQYGVSLTIVREDIPALAQRSKQSIEKAARDFRYTLFDQLATDDNHDRVALAHHADDRAETILFRILRGSGRTGLLGMPIKRGKIIRPLFFVTKAEILKYLTSHRLDYCVDRSNDLNEFSRNFIRNKLLPLIRQRLNPKAETALLSLSENISLEEDLLEQVTAQASMQVTRRTPGGKIELDLELFKSYHEAIQRRLLRRCLVALSEDGQAPDRAVIERLLALAEKQSKGLSLPGHRRAVIQGKTLVLAGVQVSVRPVALVRIGRAELPELRMKIASAIKRRSFGSVQHGRGALTVYLDAAKVRFPCTVRGIQSGDRFQPLGMRGSKKVGDFLTDRKVPLVYRDEVVLVCDETGIVWIVGQEIAERVKITDATMEVLSLEVNYRPFGTHEAL